MLCVYEHEHNLDARTSTLLMPCLKNEPSIAINWNWNEGGKAARVRWFALLVYPVNH